MLRNRRGAGSDIFMLVVYVLVLVVAGIAAAIGLSVLTNIGTSFTTGTLAANATTQAQNGIANITGQFGNIGLVIAAVVIIGLLVGGFAFIFNRQGGGI